MLERRRFCSCALGAVLLAAYGENKIKRLYDELRLIKELCRLKRKTAPARKAKFLLELKARFDVSAEGALDIIEADKTLSKEEKEEDQKFLLAIRDNCPHSLGLLDVKRMERLERIAEKERQAKERAERDKQRR